jgi:hypothetical protein
MGTTISSNSISKLISNLNPFTMVKPDTGEKIEIFVGGKDGTTTIPSIIKDENNENVGMLPNNARIYDLNYNATISATLLYATTMVKRKARKSTRSTSLPSRSCCIPLSVCFAAYHTKC